MISCAGMRRIRARFFEKIDFILFFVLFFFSGTENREFSWRFLKIPYVVLGFICKVHYFTSNFGFKFVLQIYIFFKKVIFLFY